MLLGDNFASMTNGCPIRWSVGSMHTHLSGQSCPFSWSRNGLAFDAYIARRETDV